ncbi:hypothetical protein EBR21_12425 [bacterium]|nr:hypothetical protein [bacterium]
MTQSAERGFIAEEKRATGGIGVGFYTRYLSSIQGILWMGPVLLFLIITENFFSNGFRWLVSLWVERNAAERPVQMPTVWSPVCACFLSRVRRSVVSRQ